MDWLVAAGHQPVHSYLPGSDTVQDSCLDDVDSCDLYVLMLGHRYGFQPTQDNPEGLSITQLEFRRAGQSGIPRVALLRTSIPDVGLSDLADPPRLTRVSAFREEVAREVRPAEFSDPQGLVQGLSTGVQAALDRWLPATGRLRHWGVGPVLRLAPRPLFLAGRDELLAELDVQLAAGDGHPVPRVVALCGLGGAGKTSVAVEYAHRHLPEVGLAWQFPAEEPATLTAGFAELAAQLGAGDRGDPVASVHGMLAASPAPWLLVFDNAPSRASVQVFVPPAGRGRVLITSRDQLWPPGQALEVPVLDQPVAAGFLADRTGDADRQAAVELAGELGGLALALEQAAAYMQATGHNIAKFLTLFRERRGELLTRGQVDGYNKTVATTWSVAFQRLQEICPSAVALLRLMAWCAPDQIPVLLLTHGARPPELPDAAVAEQLLPLLTDPLAADDALTALQRFSLVSRPVAGTVSVHRLVQTVTSDQLSRNQRDAWRHAAGMLINAVMPQDPYEPSVWRTYATLLPHARTALPPESAGMGNLTRYLLASGDYRTACVIGEQVLASRQRLAGDNDPGTLQAMTDLGFTQRRLGEFESAHQLLQKAVDGYGRLLGDDAADSLIARYGLGWVLRDLGHWNEAETELRAVLDRQAHQLGDQHPDCLNTRRALASVLHRQNRLREAETEFRAVLDGRRQALGDDHPDTLMSRHDLAYILQQRGRLQNAEAEYRTAYETQIRVLGEEHPSALITQQNLAALAQDQGRWDDAEQQYRAVLEARQRVLGDRHPETLVTRCALAYVLQARGDLDAAEAEYRAIIDLQCQVLGSEHPNTLGTRQNLAALLQDRGRWDEAEQQYRAVFESRRNALPDDHPDVLDSRHALAYVLQARGDLDAAEAEYRAIIDLQCQVLGPEHRNTLATRRNLAALLQDQERWDEAEQQYRAVLQARQQELGERHPDVLDSRHALAYVLQARGDLDAAEAEYRAIIDLQCQVLGPEHRNTLATRRNLAALLQDQERWDEAEQQHRAVFESRRRP